MQTNRESCKLKKLNYQGNFNNFISLVLAVAPSIALATTVVKLKSH